jgi:hypothetical protein
MDYAAADDPGPLVRRARHGRPLADVDPADDPLGRDPDPSTAYRRATVQLHTGRAFCDACAVMGWLSHAGAGRPVERGVQKQLALPRALPTHPLYV